jgi:trimethylamine--corrinoid protein Co-methyltransferase
LHWSPLALGVFRETAGFGIPVMVNSEPLGGGTAPVTLAGCLVLGDADTLSGIVINQLLEVGRPCIYNIGFAHVLDMASAIALTGAPENALLQAAGAEMARFHGLPCASWLSTESMVADSQAAFEKMMTGFAHVEAGVNFIWGAGNLESTLAMSPLALVMDNEISGYLMRYKKGFSVDEESLALDVIKEVGLSGDFISAEHTVRHFRGELSRSDLVVRTRRSAWEKMGGKSLEELAQDRLHEILEGEPRVYVDSAQAKELDRIEQTGLAELG